MPHYFHPSRRTRGERLEPERAVQLTEMRLQQYKLRGIRCDILYYGICKRGGNGSIFAARNGYVRNDEVIAGKLDKVQPAAIRNQATFSNPVRRELCRANYLRRRKRTAKIESRNREDRKCYRSDTGHKRASDRPTGGRRFLGNLRGTSRNHFPRLRVPLQTFQVSAQFARGLVAQLAVLLQRLADDFFQLERDLGIQADGSGGRAVKD